MPSKVDAYIRALEAADSDKASRLYKGLSDREKREAEVILERKLDVHNWPRD
jgi:hypothetical protein